MNNTAFSVAVFPFLKTSGRAQIGGYVFRSTEDVQGLPPNQAQAILEIAKMLFAQNDLRIKSASYAIVPPLEIYFGNPGLAKLLRLRDVVAYFYASPHEIFDNIFLGPEEISLLIFTPARVSAFLTRPDHHTESVVPICGPEPDPHGYIQGYDGLYNFRHAFWVEPGARLYGPKPHVILNISQDFCADIEIWKTVQTDQCQLFDLLERADSPASLRIFSAIRWFNAANEQELDPSQSILKLAIAFEALLRLPESSKMDRFIDAVSLLLGRTDRLNEWAHCFYAARSQVAHEGEVRDPYLYVPGTSKRQAANILGSLMHHGRHIFRLCVSAILHGIDLAERSNLQEKFISNNERYRRTGDLLKDETRPASNRLLSLEPILDMLSRYRFAAGNADAGPMMASVQLACKNLIECNQVLPIALAAAVAGCAAAERSELKRLAAIMALDTTFDQFEPTTLTPEARNVCHLVHLVCGTLFMRYHWLKEQEQQNKFVS
jgi:hypothetical protein